MHVIKWSFLVVKSFFLFRLRLIILNANIPHNNLTLKLTWIDIIEAIPNTVYSSNLTRHNLKRYTKQCFGIVYGTTRCILCFIPRESNATVNIVCVYYNYIPSRNEMRKP